MSIQGSGLTEATNDQLILDRLTKDQSVVYAKFGDGEFYAASGRNGANCDSTPYTPALQTGVKKAFQYLVQQPNCFVGHWYGLNAAATELFTFFTDLATSVGVKEIAWASYLLFIVHSPHHFDETRKALYKAILLSKRRKIYIGNVANCSSSKQLLRVDENIPIHPTMWFEWHYDQVISQVQSIAPDKEEKLMVITSAGMGAKPLIAQLHSMYKDITIIDLGSALDNLLSARHTRDYHSFYPRSEMLQFFHDCI